MTSERLALIARVTAVLFLVSLLLPVASATFTIQRCCTLAVRDELEKYWSETNGFYPWEVCNFGGDFDSIANETLPSVMKPMSWAKVHCRGTQYSNLRQWLVPLATYISPYIGILLLCPVGKEEPDDHIQRRPLMKILHKVRKTVQEYISILGDPASAVWGAVHEVISDTRALYRVSRRPVTQQRPVWIAALAGALRFSDRRSNLGQLQSKPVQTERDNLLLKKDNSKSAQAVVTVSSPISTVATTTSTNTNNKNDSSRPGDPWSEEDVDKAISLIMVARPSFAHSILIPVVLMLAVMAATFYDAYAKKGDKDTGLALAYTVWFSWILVVGVAGNCFATALNPELAWRAFGQGTQIPVASGGLPAVVALRGRYVNSQFWGDWVERQQQQGPDDNNNSKDVGGDSEVEGAFACKLRSDAWFWLRYCGWQFAGWACVAVASGGAAGIAYMTPTVGLGCRSFNFVLYAIIAFVNAYLHVVCSWLSVREKSQLPEEKSQVEEEGKGGVMEAISRALGLKAIKAKGVTPEVVIRSIYWFLTFGNSLVMVLGTLFHLVGVFRTCWCDRLTWNDDTMIELNSKTPEAVENAGRYWISTAYVVFSIMTLICLAAIVMRQIIIQSMEQWFQQREE
ncbi:hypothetical protein N656DRAFT_783946 [Canariomyces notabilis]|uniref:Uncharacterized protein n=1 Tax=Canariomyces notabilis TaxID=2074819 RepID=A0AAN6QKP0_9PEZI|nr:hypothetical protein N656DRAFT_783946 [Canariomyces arenarius]